MSRKSEDSNITDCLDWQDVDFKQARLRLDSLRTKDPHAELVIRQENIETVSRVLEDCDIPFWIHGKTLLGIVRDGQFIITDHDDDVGILLEHRHDLCDRAYPKLKEHGFQAIRCNDVMLSVIRNDRYVDICFFRQRKGKIGYGKKWFPKEYFEAFDSVTFNRRQYPIPINTQELLDIMYPNKRDEPDFLTKLYKPVRKIKRKIKRTRKWIKSHILQKKFVRPVLLEDFLDLKIEDDAAINWTLRAPHLNIITNNGKLRIIRDIIEYFKTGTKLEDTKNNLVVETDTSQPFEEPINLNNRFWQTGNNYLFYCIYYSFRKDIVSYDRANEYIRNVREPRLYTAEYFEKLAPMDDMEIENLLKAAPLIINRGAIVHGKHRVCAMIGRVIAGKTYIPFQTQQRVPRFT